MELCEIAIKEGNAYADNLSPEQIHDKITGKQDSPNRSNTLEQNLAYWAEMKKGTDEGKKWCIRAKIIMNHSNRCMRDPVLYRVNLTPHHRTGEKYKVYPLYDFACPIVDSIEGVSHAGRSME